MAAEPRSVSNPNTSATTADLEADLRQLKADVAKLTEQLARTGQHTIGTARRAASEGVEHLRAQGEAAIDGLRENARDLEDQLTSTVREKPIVSIAIAAAIGYVFALMNRR